MPFDEHRIKLMDMCVQAGVKRETYRMWEKKGHAPFEVMREPHCWAVYTAWHLDRLRRQVFLVKRGWAASEVSRLIREDSPLIDEMIAVFERAEAEQ